MHTISLRRGTGSSVNSSCVIYPITAMYVPPSPPPLLYFSISSVSAHVHCCYHLFFSKGERRLDLQLQLPGELVQLQFWKSAHCESWMSSEH